MTKSINLMPERCRETLGRRRMIRSWVIFYVSTLVLIWAGFFVSRAGRGSQVSERAALSAQVQLNWSRNETAQKLIAEIKQAEDHIQRYNDLAWPVRVSEVVTELASVTPDAVTLTTLTLTPREETWREKPANGKKGKDVTRSRTLLLIELEGIVLNDMEAASMVSGLDVHPLFESVVLDFSRPHTVDGTDARAFRLTSRIDMSKRYSFVDATTEVAQ